MAKETIAQMREKELERLVAYKTDNPTEADFDEARGLMNSYYRLCGLSEKNLYLANDERTCNTKETEDSEEREMKWCKRLNEKFNELYGLSLVYCGYLPSICIKHKNGSVGRGISTFFYER